MMEHDAASVCEGGFHERAITIRYQYHYTRAPYLPTASFLSLGKRAMGDGTIIHVERRVVGAPPALLL